MWHKIKNLLIFILIAGILVVGYVLFVQKPETPNLVSSTNSQNSNSSTSFNRDEDTDLISQEFLNLLFSVKSINIDASVFANKSFNSLKDSSIILIPDGTEGRKNPFAPIGTENTQAASYLLSGQAELNSNSSSGTDLLLPGREIENKNNN